MGAVKQDARIMTDAQVAKLLRVSTRTIYRRVKFGPQPGEIDIRNAEPMAFGNHRLWLRENVEKLLGIKQKEK